MHDLKISCVSKWRPELEPPALSVLSVELPMLSVEAAASFPVLAVVLLSLELPHPATMDANIDAHNKVLITFSS